MKCNTIWILIAPPKFMGPLRDILPSSVAAKVGAKLIKDLTKLSIHQLPDHLRLADAFGPMGLASLNSDD